MRKRFFAISLLSLCAVASYAAKVKIDKTPKDIYSGVPFNMEAVPEIKFKNNTLSISDCGAIGNGTYDNTEAFRKAIDSVAGKGGGHVIVPQGIWLTGPIVMKSNIDLHLEKGALIFFTKDKKQYKIAPSTFEGLNTRRCVSQISGDNLENIAITGEGVIDGNGDVWRAVKKRKMAPYEWNKLVKKGGIVEDEQWYPSQSYLDGKRMAEDQNIPIVDNDSTWENIRDFLRPTLLGFKNCKNIVLDGVMFQNSPSWCLHPLMCKNIRISNITVRNPWYAQNGDALDLESCQNAIVYNSTFDAGDDAICIKSGKDEDGRKRNMPCKNIVVKNCTVLHGHGGFVVGSEMSGGAKNMYVKDCLFMGTDVGLRFKSKRGRGGVVENVFIDKVNMIDIKGEAILFDLFYGNKNVTDKGKVPADITTPEFKSIHIKNINCNGAKKAMFFNGLPEKNITEVSLENINITSDNGAEMVDAANITMTNADINCKKGAMLKLTRVKDSTFDNIKSSQSDINNVEKSGCQNINTRNIEH